MNIIWLTPEVPYPPIGGRNGVYNRIIQLGKNNRIFLFSIAYNQVEKNNTFEMRKHCIKVNFYDRSQDKIGTIAKSLIYPFSIASRFRQDICRDIEDTLSKETINVIIVDFPNMAKNIFDLSKNHPEILFTLNQHNVEYVRMRGMLNVKSIPAYKRLMYYLESLRLEAYEKKLYRTNIFKAITFFSEKDKVFFEEHIDCGNAVLKTIPLGANSYNKLPLKLRNKSLLFVGRLDHIAIPNLEAMVWFVNSVWPRIKEKVTDAKLIIAGADPEYEIRSMASNDIKIVPNFPNMGEVYNMADCVILPLLSGGGVKGKLLEAIAFRKFIVTTDHGIEGTLFKDKDHVFLANDEISFADSCSEVLLYPEKYEDREQHAYKLFKEQYDWNTLKNQYQSFIESLL